jgi:hypothetical protein
MGYEVNTSSGSRWHFGYQDHTKNWKDYNFGLCCLSIMSALLETQTVFMVFIENDTFYKNWHITRSTSISNVSMKMQALQKFRNNNVTATALHILQHRRRFIVLILLSNNVHIQIWTVRFSQWHVPCFILRFKTRGKKYNFQNVVCIKYASASRVSCQTVLFRS